MRKVKASDVSKRDMIDALVFQRITKRGLVNNDNAYTTARAVGFFMWLFSFPYDWVKRKVLLLKFRRKQAKIKTKRDK